jgi:NAD(P)-dependent dehydrogenase (short-subunit alcohol dehydrogenase family)
MDQLLADSVAVVTGGASGIGRETCLRFAEEGADVVVADVRAEPREGDVPTHEAVSELDADGGARFVECDVTDRRDLAAAADAAVDAFGGLDVWVNNAGVYRTEDFADVSTDQYDDMMDINARGPFFGAQVAAERMDEGSIVNVASVAGRHGTGNHPVYSASKAAVENMTKSMADALGPDIRVNAVLPGIIATAMTREDVPTVNADRAERYEGEIPLERFGEPSDIADSVVYLVSDLAEYVTGEAHVVDGGLSGT